MDSLFSSCFFSNNISSKLAKTFDIELDFELDWLVIVVYFELDSLVVVLVESFCESENFLTLGLSFFNVCGI
jgi:hypothetical protein